MNIYIYEFVHESECEPKSECVFEFEFNVNVFVVVTNVDEICPIQFAYAMSYPTKLNMPCPVQLSLELKNFYRKHTTMPSQGKPKQ